MKLRVGVLLAWTFLGLVPGRLMMAAQPERSAPVYILPVRDDIMPPLLYLVRRGVKAAIEHKAAVLILDMDTHGGRIDTTEEIIRILNQFKGETVTYVNRKAFSAGAYISVATQRIYMAPESVIGAAAPLLMIPGGGPAELPATVEAKMTSGVRALVRTSAEKNGYNVEVIDAMIDKNKELEIDGDVLNRKGEILTLTNRQAEKKYGNPPKPLLSSGTVDSLSALVAELGYAEAAQVYVRPTGVEKLGAWINAISPLLLIVGVLGIYLEFKMPGVALPGILGVAAFTLYFLGGYVAGLSGMEWIAVFVLGLILFGLELFVFPGTAVLGLAGAVLMLAAILMAMVDIYPSAPGLPGPWQFRVPLTAITLNLAIAVAGSIAAIWMLSRLLPKTSIYAALVSRSVSGEGSVRLEERQQEQRLGDIGVAVSVLRPGGKARFGEDLLDVISQGEMIAAGAKIRIIGHSGTEAVVTEVT
jgi:membrane-bound serine protease (ClpP class)